MADISYKIAKGMKISYSEEESKHIFFTSDTHFNHSNILGFCHRPFKDVEDMNNKLIENWNNVVKPDDTIFHLGDFAWGGAPVWRNVLDKLNGHKILILGNHDMKNITETIAKECFDYVLPKAHIYINGRAIYLNHEPLMTYSGVYRKPENVVYQLFGHIHSGPLSESTDGKDLERLNLLFPTQYDVGVDNNNFTPISWIQVDNIIQTQIQNDIRKI